MDNQGESSSPLWLTVAQAAGSLVVLAVAIAAVWVIGTFAWGLSVGIWNGMQSELTVSPEEKAQIEKAAKDWETDPRNPKVAGQKCLDLGGVPDYSAWDGDVKACNKPGADGKNVKIEVNQ